MENRFVVKNFRAATNLGSSLDKVQRVTRHR
jgi:hypothetical protein